jgi:hypothetical protein
MSVVPIIFVWALASAPAWRRSVISTAKMIAAAVEFVYVFVALPHAGRLHRLDLFRTLT